MISAKSQFLQHTLAAITFIFILGALSLIWPGIIALFLGALLLFQSLSTEPEMAVLSWNEVSHLPIILASL